MRNYFLCLTACVVALALTGCTSTVATSGVYEAAVPAASSCSAAPAAGPVAGPLMVPAGAPTLGVQYGIGPTDHAKAALSIPPNMAICLINGIRCAVDALFPQPTPSARYVSVQPVMVAPAAPAAAPCAPPPPPRFAPVKACPAPPPEPIAAVCTDETCAVPGR